MKKTFKKIGAIVLTLAMIFALSATAWATGVDKDLGSYEGSQDRNYGINTTDNTIPITKSIVIFNPESTNVREPDLKFEYAVEPVTAAAELGTITDDGRYNSNNPVTVQVNEGVAGVVTGTTITFDKTATVAATATGTVKERSGSFAVDLTNITHAGVYRYKITETVKGATSNTAVTDLTTYGLEARTADYDTTRYLDIYVSNDTSGSTPALVLTGAIIFKVNTVDDSNTPATTGITTTTDKTTGYEPGAPDTTGGSNDYTNDTEVDRYFTYNLKVGKTTTGNLADLNHDFPFEIKLTAASTLVPTVVTDLTVTGAINETAGTRNIANGSVLTLSPKMSNGDYIELKGIPKGTTVTVKETNDTPDIYTASLDATAGTTSTTATLTSDNTDTSDLALANGKSATTSSIAIDGNQTTEYVKTVIGLTNTLAEISPTGVVMRVAPYAAIGGAGFLFFAVSKKFKKEEDEEEA